MKKGKNKLINKMNRVYIGFKIKNNTMELIQQADAEYHWLVYKYIHSHLYLYRI